MYSTLFLHLLDFNNFPPYDGIEFLEPFAVVESNAGLPTDDITSSDPFGIAPGLVPGLPYLAGLAKAGQFVTPKNVGQGLALLVVTTSTLRPAFRLILPPPEPSPVIGSAGVVDTAADHPNDLAIAPALWRQFVVLNGTTPTLMVHLSVAQPAPCLNGQTLADVALLGWHPYGE